MKTCHKLGPLTFFRSLPVWSAESPHTAKIAQFFGKAKILSNRSNKKSSQPPHAAEAAGKKIDKLQVLQAVTLDQALGRAPEPIREKIEALEKAGILEKPAPAARKPTPEQLDKLEIGVYDKYFKR